MGDKKEKWTLKASFSVDTERIVQRLEQVNAKTKKQIKGKLIELAAGIEKAEQMTAAEAEEYAQKVICGITREQYEKDFKRGIWGSSTEADRQGFGVYVTSLVRQDPTIAHICKGARSFQKKLQKWIADYVAEVYPSGPYAKTIQGPITNNLLLAGKEGQEKKGKTLVNTINNIKYYFRDSDKHNEIALTPNMALVQHLVHTKITKVIDWQKLASGEGRSIKRLEDFLTLLDSYEIEITSEEYLELTGRNCTKKEMTKKLGVILDRLCAIGFSWQIGKGEIYKGMIYQGQYIKERGGIFRLTPSNDFLKCCLKSDPADYHTGIYRVDCRRYRYAVAIYIKLWWQFMLSRGRAGNGLLKVSNLLEAVPDIPKYQDLMASNNRNWGRLIREPLENNLQELMDVGVLKSWEYSNTGGDLLTDEQAKLASYNEFENLYIKYDLELPEQGQYITRHAAKLERRKKAAEKRAERKRQQLEARRKATKAEVRAALTEIVEENRSKKQE